VREERVVDTGLEYAPGDRVLVRVVKRDGRERVSDDARAAAKAGRSRVPETLVRRVEEEFVVNVSRRGEIFLPGERFADRVARASLALYQDLLDLG
jgi:hypothetical protein